MDEKKYTNDGFLIVAETDKCTMWEADAIPCRTVRNRDCFFCKYADFRTEETIRRTEGLPRGTKLYSICQNKENKKSDMNTN